MAPRITSPVNPLQEPRIVLVWIKRLRWLAVVGQLAAVFFAAEVMGLRLPLVPIGGVILLTLVTNLILVAAMRHSSPAATFVPGILLLDVGLLTALLYFTGGSRNPFSILYLVHVAMAVVVLGSGWTWGVVASAAFCYGLLVRWHWPMELDLRAERVGSWVALVLVAVLIAYFIDRIRRSLRHRERELERAREHAQRNEQLAALTTLAAGAAHELGTPLATIAVVAKELERQAPGEITDDAILIRQQVERCRTILDRMRADLGDNLTHRGNPMALAQVLRGVQEGFTEEQRRRLQIHCALPTDFVITPARAIEQAVTVLIRNSFDATESSQPIQLSIFKRESKLIFEVEDRGQGMDNQTLRRAGQPFFTTKSPGKGMGLGLFLVRLTAERYGGSLTLHSEPERGTQSVLAVELARVSHTETTSRSGDGA
jgi:two-component system sensor histidine kinase RegB